MVTTTNKPIEYDEPIGRGEMYVDVDELVVAGSPNASDTIHAVRPLRPEPIEVEPVQDSEPVRFDPWTVVTVFCIAIALAAGVLAWMLGVSQ